MKVVASNYGMLQIGFSLFLPQEDGSLIARPYNFYCFPRVPKELDGRISMSTVINSSAMDFNCQHGMDFNKWAHEGVSTLDESNAEKVHQLMWPKRRPVRDSGPTAIEDAAEAKAAESQLNSVAQWVSDHLSRGTNASASLEERSFAIGEGGSQYRGFFTAELAKLASKLDMQVCTDDLTATIDDYKQAIQDFERGVGPSDVTAVEPNHSERLQLVLEHNGTDIWWKKSLRLVLLTRSEIDHRRKRDAQQRLLREREFVGLRLVFLALSDECQRRSLPLVVHNGNYDLMFMWRWCQGALPDTFEQYRQAMHTKFPLIYDTKNLVTHPVYNASFKPNFSSVITSWPLGSPLRTAQQLSSMQLSPPAVVNPTGRSLGEIYKSVRQVEQLASQVQRTDDDEAKLKSLVPNGDELKFMQIRFDPTNGFDRYETDASAFHEAAFDAYITGYVFIQLYYAPAIDAKRFDQPLSRLYLYMDDHFKNRVHLMQHAYSMNYGDSLQHWNWENTNTHQIFYVSGLPIQPQPMNRYDLQRLLGYDAILSTRPSVDVVEQGRAAVIALELRNAQVALASLRMGLRSRAPDADIMVQKFTDYLAAKSSDFQIRSSIGLLFPQSLPPPPQPPSGMARLRPLSQLVCGTIFGFAAAAVVFLGSKRKL